MNSGGVLRLTEPRSNRNTVAAFSPALTDAVGLRWVSGQNENNSGGVVAGWRRIGCNAFSVDEFVGTVYGITQTKLTALKKKIDAFEASLAKPRQQIAESSAATQTLQAQFAEADTILNKRLDKLVYQFKESAPDFFNAYQTARSIVDLRGSRKTNDTPTPAPAPQPA